MTEDTAPARLGRGAYRAGRETREALVVTAERLFAERGIDAVSLREIAVEAGSRNSGAAQYYFGGKDDLLRAILEFRSRGLNQRRAELLEEIGPDADVRELLRALVLPLAEVVDDTRFAGFLAGLQADFAQSRRELHPHGAIDTMFRQAQARLAAALPELTEERFQFRFRLTMRMVVATLGEHDLRPDVGIRDTATMVAELLDAAAGLMLAPATVS